MLDSPQVFLRRLLCFAVGPAVSSILRFFSVPVITWLVSPSELGKAAMFTMAYELTRLLVLLGFDEAFVRGYSGTSDKTNLFWNALVVPVLASVFLMLLVLMEWKHISLVLFDSLEKEVMFLLALSVPTWCPRKI